MDTNKIIEDYYTQGTELYDLYMKHARSVRDKALTIASELSTYKPDTEFIEQASILHDIGIIFTNAPSILCNGDFPYICHGYIGCEILLQRGFKPHGLVCERHTLMGISKGEIVERDLPLPKRDMMPVTIEEKIICYADCFFSKTGDGKEKEEDQVVAQLGKYGEEQVRRFYAIRNLLEGDR